MLTFLFCYLIAVNVILFAVMARDKAAAQRGQRRVPETTLLALAVIGGSVGGILGMLVFRHKTRKPAFSVGFPVILLVQTAVGCLIYLKK